MVQFYLFPVFMACLCLQTTDSLREASSRHISMLTDNNGKSRKKVINPNDIANVFNKKEGKTQKVQFENVEESNNSLYNDENDKDEENYDDMIELTRQSVDEKSTINTKLVAELKQLDKDIKIDTNIDENINTTLNVEIQSEAANEEQSSPVDTQQSPISKDDDEICYDDDCLNLSNLVDTNASRDLSNTMSIMNGGRRGSSTRTSVSNSDEDMYALQNLPPRVFQYDPTEKVKIDPMVFGAYRRSKLPPSPPDSQKSGSTKLKSGRKNNNNSNKDKDKQSTTDNFYDQIKKFGSGPGAKGGSASTGVAEPPPGMRNITPKKAPTSKNRRKIVTPEEINSLFVKNTKQQQKQQQQDSIGMNQQQDDNNSDSDSKSFNKQQVGVGNMGGFMDGIKNSLSSVYNQAAAASNIEIMDNDIDTDNSKANQYDDDDDDDNDDIESDTDNSSKNQEKDTLSTRRQQKQQLQSSSSLNSMAVTKSNSNNNNNKSFNPTIADEKFPKWLIDAEKEKIKAEKERLPVAKGKRKKKLTDDWRFWAAIITTIGFGTAFYSIYQQTGGFDTDISAFNFGMPTTGGSGFSGGAAGGSDELII